MYSKLIVPLDGSPFAEHALATAALLAKASGAEIELITAHFPPMFAVDRGTTSDDLLRQGEHDYLARIGAAFRSETDLTVRSAVRDGVPADAICEYADWFADALIVMTTHGRTGFNRAWIGSVADAIVKHSRHAVLMVRSTETPAPWTPSSTATLGRVLVPLDGTTFAEEALAHGSHIATLVGSELELLRVVELSHPFVVPFTAPPYAGVPLVPTEAVDSMVESGTSYVAKVATRERNAHPEITVVTDLVVAESPARAIVDVANKHGVDLIAMATHGRGVSRLVRPSVADKVLRGAAGAVLLVKAASD